MFAELIFAILFGALGLVLYQRIFGKGNNNDGTQGGKGKNKHKNKNQKSNKGKGQQNNKKNNKGGSSYKQHLKKGATDPLSFKPKIDLKNENPSLTAVFRGHTREITSLSWVVDYDDNGDMMVASSSMDGSLSFWKLPHSHSKHKDKDKEKSVLIGKDAHFTLECPTRGGHFSLMNSNVSNNPDTSFIVAMNKKTRKLSVFQQSGDNNDNSNNNNNSGDYDEVKTNSSGNGGVVESGSMQYQTRSGDKIFPKFLEIHPNGKFFGIATINNKEQNIRFYDPNCQGSNKIQKLDEIKFNGENDDKYQNNMFSISPDGNYCAVSRSDNTLHIFEAIWHKPTQDEMKEGTKYNYNDINQIFFQHFELFYIIKSVHAKANKIPCALFSNDSRFVISGSSTGDLRVWQLNCGNSPSADMVCETNIGDDLKSHSKSGGNNNSNNNRITFHGAILSAYNILATLVGNHNGKHVRRIIFYHVKHLDDLSSQQKHIKFKFLGELDEPLSTKGDGNVTAMKFSPNGKYFAIGGTDFDVRVYKVPRISHGKK